MATGLHSITSMIVRAAAAALLWSLALGASAQTVRYIHTDALGSVAVVTDQNRNVIERREYEPYGFQLTPAVKDGPGYTGHVQDATTGLTYMQQRYFDPQLGLFLSTDSVTAYGGNIRHFNRYAYAYNNPYKFTDPDGRCPFPGSSLCGKSLDVIQAQDSMRIRSEATLLGKILWLGVEFAPIAGDLVGGLEAVDKPTPANLAGGLIGLFGPAGDAGRLALKHSDSIGDLIKLVSNPKHHPNSVSREPRNVINLFENSVPDASGVRWAKDPDGVIHRFSRPSNGEVHWNGSTAGDAPIRSHNIPNDIKKKLGE